MFNPAIASLTAPPVSVVLDWRASYNGDKGALIDMSQAVPGYAAHPCLLYTSPSPRDATLSRMPSSA